MSIDEKKIQLAEISIKFIKLMDSKRGLQTKLAKAVGKNPSYFSEIKRGKPVNATHLRAAGLLFGLSVVAELMSIDINSKSENHLKKSSVVLNINDIPSNYSKKIDNLLRMAKEILTADMEYSDSLAANIRSFHRAIKMEKRLQDIEARLEAVEANKKTGNKR